MAPRHRILSRTPSGVDDVVDSSSSSSTSSPTNSQERIPLVLESNGKGTHTTVSETTNKNPATSSTSVSGKEQHIDDGNVLAAEERTRENHDYFNLVALIPVIVATAINWDMVKLLQGPEVSYIGEYFFCNWATTVLYFLTDLTWVASVPTCVKSPDTIIKHHIVATLYLSGPIIWPEYRWIMGGLLSVEINTWCLILRRVAYKKKEVFPEPIRSAISLLFYATWIIIRIGIYPAIMYKFIWMAIDDYIRNGLAWHYEYLVLPAHFFLCLLNLKWSYDLFLPFFIQQTKKESYKSLSGGL